MGLLAEIYDEPCRRCSIEAGDPEGGCQKFNAGICQPVSVLKAKSCLSYIPSLVIV